MDQTRLAWTIRQAPRAPDDQYILNLHSPQLPQMWEQMVKGFKSTTRKKPAIEQMYLTGQ